MYLTTADVQFYFEQTVLSSTKRVNILQKERKNYANFYCLR